MDRTNYFSKLEKDIKKVKKIVREESSTLIKKIREKTENYVGVSYVQIYNYN